MGRAKASNLSREFSITFANVVSVPSNAKNDWIAKNGCFSLFKLLSAIAPKACRGYGGDRQGISEAELNKALESNGFTRVRVRLRSIVASAGTLLFDARRWLNPNSESDLHLLIRAFGALRTNYPHLLTCDETYFLRTVARHRDEWVLRTRGGGRAAAEALCRTSGSAAPYSAIICTPTLTESDSCASSRRSSESTCMKESELSELSEADTPGFPAGQHPSMQDSFSSGAGLVPSSFLLRGKPGCAGPQGQGFAGQGFMHGWPGLYQPSHLSAVSEREVNKDDDQDDDADSDGSSSGDLGPPGTCCRPTHALVPNGGGGSGGGNGGGAVDAASDAARVADYLRKRFFAACLAGQLRLSPPPPPPPAFIYVAGPGVPLAWPEPRFGTGGMPRLWLDAHSQPEGLGWVGPAAMPTSLRID
jgi:hypothetical protein